MTCYDVAVYRLEVRYIRDTEWGRERITNTAWYLYSFGALFVLYEVQLDNKSLNNYLYGKAPSSATVRRPRGARTKKVALQ